MMPMFTDMRPRIAKLGGLANGDLRRRMPPQGRAIFTSVALIAMLSFIFPLSTSLCLGGVAEPRTPENDTVVPPMDAGIASALEASSTAYVIKSDLVETPVRHMTTEELKALVDAIPDPDRRTIGYMIKGLQSTYAYGRLLDRGGSALRAELDDDVARVAFDGFLSGLTGEHTQSLQEFRVGPGKRLEAWLFRARAQQTARDLATIEHATVCTNLAEAAERHFTSRDAAARVEWINGVDFSDTTGMVRDALRQNGKPAYDGGRVGVGGIALRFSGPGELTNVLVVVERESTGIVNGPTSDQLELLGLNAATGFGDHNPSAIAYVTASNYRATMPTKHHFYRRSIKRGETIYIVVPYELVGWAHKRTVARIYTDQGSMDNVVIFEKSSRRGTNDYWRQFGNAKRRPSVKPSTPASSDEPEPAQPKATQPSDTERSARALLSLARSYNLSGRSDRYVELLKQVIDQFPDTKAAEDARFWLKLHDER